MPQVEASSVQEVQCDSRSTYRKQGTYGCPGLLPICITNRTVKLRLHVHSQTCGIEIVFHFVAVRIHLKKDNAWTGHRATLAER